MWQCVRIYVCTCESMCLCESLCVCMCVSVCLYMCEFNVKPSLDLDLNLDVDSVCQNQQPLFHPLRCLQPQTSCFWRPPTKTNSSCCAMYNKNAEVPVCCAAGTIHQHRHTHSDLTLSASESVYQFHSLPWCSSQVFITYPHSNGRSWLINIFNKISWEEVINEFLKNNNCIKTSLAQKDLYKRELESLWNFQVIFIGYNSQFHRLTPRKEKWL